MWFVPVRISTLLLSVLLGLLGISAAWGQTPPSDPTPRTTSHLYDPTAGELAQRYVGPETYDADGQNWGATQDTSGNLYVANTKGVLVYNGHTWRTVLPANRSLVRSVAADDQGRVFAGAKKEFGVLRRDSTGRRRYVSLLDHVPERHRSFTDIWNTEVTSEGVYFHSYRRLFRWTPETKTMQSWAPPQGTEFNQGGIARDTFFVGADGRGLMAVQDDSLRMVAGGEAFADRSVVFVTSHPQHGVVVGTYGGLFVRDGGSFRPLPTEIDRILDEGWLYGATTLADGTLAIATIEAGLLLVEPDGTLRRHLHPRDRPVPDVYEDREGGLWALLDGGLMRYDLKAPFTEYGAQVGLDKSVQDVAWHRGSFYVATLQSLYRRRATDDTLAMVPVSTEEQSWSLLSMGEDLLVGITQGLERIRPNGTVDRLFDANYVYKLRRSRHDSSLVYAGTDRGVRLVRKADTGWAVGPQVPGLDTEARSLAEANDSTLWVGTTFDGVYRVRLADPIDSTTVDHFGTDHGLPPDRVAPQHWNGRLVFGTSNGLMRFVETPRPHFEPISSVEMPSLERNEGVARLQALESGEAWGFTGWGPGRWVQRDTTWRWAPGLLHRLRGRAILTVHTEENREIFWFGTEKGLLRYAPGAPRPGAPPPTRIQAVRILDADSLLPIAATPNPSLSYAHNSVKIAYGTPSLAQPSAIEYQYRVPSRSPAWSDWTARTERELQNLAPGPVTFAVRARTAYGDTTRTTRMAFTVLPPWYRTWWAYGFYGLLAVWLVAGAVRWRTRQLRRRQEELEKTVAERTEQIREKNDELAQQAEKLKELDEAKSRFFANVSHEFRTPLTLIRGPVQEVRERLQRTDVDLDNEADQLAVVERNTDRLRRLVDQLLALARMDAGSYELAVRPTDLHAETERIARPFEPLAERHDLTLTVDLEASDGNAPPVHVDREALEHILGNLLSNAIKFTPEGGTVTVTVTDEPKHVAVAVTDTGPGIPEEKQDTVFDRFAQVNEGPSGDQEGLGIGLAFAADLVDLHGATISLDSTEGEGTTVTVRFARGSGHLADDQRVASTASDDTDPSTAPRPPQPSNFQPSFPNLASASDLPSPSEDAQTQTVLVVDDNADVRRYVRSVLAADYDVIEAENGQKGLTQAREVMPDCILADVMMPEMDGVTMVRHLRQDAATESIPVVMLTARAGAEHEVEGLQAGADDYVTKPFDADVLRARVAGMIEVQRRLRRRIRAELERRDDDGQPDDSPVEEHPGSVSAAGDQAPDTAPPQLVVPTASDEEPEFVQAVRGAIENRLADPDLSVEELASAVAVSRSTLYRRLKEQADATPSQFLRQVRIEHGARLLRENEGTVSEVAYAVGFNSLSYFSKQFREHLDQSPSEYVEAVA